jgi:hypothetical protein
MAKKNEQEKHQGGNGVFCIPAGLFLGIGVGMLYNNTGAGTLIGLGAGFLAWAILGTLKR